MSVLVGFSGLLASSALSLGYMRQKQNLCISLLCLSLSPMVPNLLSTFQSLIFVLYIMLGF